MTRSTRIVLLASITLLPGVLAVTRGADAPKAAAPAAAGGASQPAERFDELVRNDFFTGITKNDMDALSRGMKTCEDVLAKNPEYPEALVWHGNGLLFLSGQTFRSGDVAKGMEQWQRGLREVNDAVALAPDNVAVLIPRGATFLASSRFLPDPNQSRQLVATGVADYERVLRLQKDYFASMATHSRGELLSGLAEGWYRMGYPDRSRAYFKRISEECKDTEYATRADKWLATTQPAELQKLSAAMNCIGCHE